jgi:hypothetical protein
MAQALTAISASPGARALYDAERARGGQRAQLALTLAVAKRPGLLIRTDGGDAFSVPGH